MNDQFVFFYGGPFSQWVPCKFEVSGIKYCTAEQFMMAAKAKIFGDKETYAKIMASSDPREQKALGRQVKNFNATLWANAAEEVVYIGNYAKFSDPTFKQILLDTGNKEIVEASPYDTIWGIGMGEGDPDRFDKTKWKGTNLLGEVLMKVRRALRNEALHSER